MDTKVLIKKGTKKALEKNKRAFPPPPPPPQKRKKLDDGIKEYDNIQDSNEIIKNSSLPTIVLTKVEPIDNNPLRNLKIEYEPYFDEISLQGNINVFVNSIIVGYIWKQDQYIDHETNTLAPVDRFVFTIWTSLDNKFTISELRASNVVILKEMIEEEYTKFFEYVKKWQNCFY